MFSLTLRKNHGHVQKYIVEDLQTSFSLDIGFLTFSFGSFETIPIQTHL
jgi:hypothetical protein